MDTSSKAPKAAAPAATAPALKSQAETLCRLHAQRRALEAEIRDATKSLTKAAGKGKKQVLVTVDGENFAVELRGNGVRINPLASL